LNPNAAYWIELFGKVGIGQWFRYFTGSLEVVCAILLLIPITSAIAATFLALIMAGAVATHLFILRDGYATFSRPSPFFYWRSWPGRELRCGWETIRC